jgi:formate dehydrogenase major subunit
MPRQKNQSGYVRLTEPLVKTRNGLRPAAWSDALDQAAEGFRKIRDTHGGDALGIFSCSKSTNEMNFLAGKLARVGFRTSNVDSCNRT